MSRPSSAVFSRDFHRSQRDFAPALLWPFCMGAISLVRRSRCQQVRIGTRAVHGQLMGGSHALVAVAPGARALAMCGGVCFALRLLV